MDILCHFYFPILFKVISSILITNKKLTHNTRNTQHKKNFKSKNLLIKVF